jgi:hypothetical protein
VVRVGQVPVSKLEKWWEEDLVGRELDQPAPKWSYQESLARVAKDPPKETLEEEGVLNRTVLIDEEEYIANWNGNTAFEEVEVNHETYGYDAPFLFVSEVTTTDS